ncbi:hypothetical protein GHK92_08010 [Nocardioides sp. dk4132]|uniref:hypothetical protein n=1 Tax=unclassified Nocardioides TaxID=2615069 RepID=UPI001294DFAA|nr:MULTISPECIES: hypothetical protein [unclassified Nocardioides]MQW75815.1 hypothetical protein [Nocardioides sp. dk4132]QGA08689.1 hypothetical protein GFH29_15770 [Nocardioides sp. dk884]
MLAFRRTVAASVVLAVAGFAPTSLAPHAAASPETKCDGQDRDVIKRVENVSKKFVATHVEAITLARGTSFTQSVALTHSKTLKSTTNVGTEIGGSTTWAFNSLSAKASMSVAREGARTSTKTVTRTFSIPEKNHDRRFVLFTGKYKVKGRWHHLSCSRAPGIGVEKYGPIKSFGGSDTGTVLCPRSRYKAGDYRYKVARQGGC